jgi:centromeric protein E
VTPSFLNGTGDGKSISRQAATRNSDGLISVASPPQSRSSSAQDSYSTSATQYDDVNDMAPPRTDTAMGGKRASKSDGKGNVLVSVRVRPDAGGNENAEWNVDGRKSLIAYKGKEGGDYFYGKNFESWTLWLD